MYLISNLKFLLSLRILNCEQRHSIGILFGLSLFQMPKMVFFVFIKLNRAVGHAGLQEK